MGSTRVARRMGTIAANSDTVKSTVAETRNAEGSRDDV